MKKIFAELIYDFVKEHRRLTSKQIGAGMLEAGMISERNASNVSGMCTRLVQAEILAVDHASEGGPAFLIQNEFSKRALNDAIKSRRGIKSAKLKTGLLYASADGPSRLEDTGRLQLAAQCLQNDVDRTAAYFALSAAETVRLLALELSVRTRLGISK